MWESQVLLTDDQVVFFPRILRFSPIFDERSVDISEIILKGPKNPKQKKKISLLPSELAQKVVKINILVLNLNEFGLLLLMCLKDC